MVMTAATTTVPDAVQETAVPPVAGPMKHEKHTMPDFDGVRFCRHCNARIPLSLFPKGKRRYVCRQHAWQHVKKPHKARVAADARRALLFKQWQRCYADAKTFQHAHIEFTQEGLARLLNAVGSEDSTTMAAVPRDPGRVLSNGNAVVVPNDARKKLLRTRRRQGAEAYITELAHIDAT